MLPFVVETFRRFERFPMARVFAHCGYTIDGHFDPTQALGKEKRKTPDLSGQDDELEFRVRETVE